MRQTFLTTAMLAILMLTTPIGSKPLPLSTRHSVTVYSGSLKSNITRIAKAFGWNKIVWNVPEDYNWTGKTRIYGASVTKIMQKILNKFPLQARFYKGNHILVIVPRTL